MHRTPLLVAAAAATMHLSSFAQDATMADLRAQLQQLRQDYEARLKALEARLEAAEKAAASPTSGPVAAAPPPSTSPAVAAPAAPATPSGLSVSAVLGGTWSHLRSDPGSWRLQGFIPGGDEIGPGSRSFQLGESEVTLSASVDPFFAGRLTVGFTPDGEAEVEEAVVRTTALGAGFTAAGGRFLSALGTLNTQHAHAWDFVDLPLAHQAFFGGQHRTDGLQLRWVAPTDTFVELTGELGRGDAFPGSERGRNGAGSASLGLHVGGEWGAATSWRAGAAVLGTRAADRTYEDVDAAGVDVVNAFTGNSRTAVLDGVLKWAPGGSRGTSLTLQGEYLWRRESGTLAYDVDGASLGPDTGAYRSRQSGWYVQGVYRFLPAWRIGLRHDRLRSGTPRIERVDDGTLAPQDFALLAPYTPRRTSAMVDYSLTEFSRLRLQVAGERTRPGPSDRQVFLQYIMSLGAHGAHAW